MPPIFPPPGISPRLNGGSYLTRRRRINFIEGTGITITVVDDPTSREIDLTITATGGGAGHTLDGADHQDVDAMTEAAGDQLRRDALNGTWENFAIGASGTFNRSDGSTVSMGAIQDGDIPATHSGSAHHTQSHDHSAAGDGQTLQPLNLDLTSPTTLTIVSGDITVTQDYHLIAGEGASDDNLDGIAGGSAGRLLLIRPSSDSVTITVRSNRNAGAVNNILLPDGQEVILDEEESMLLLAYDPVLDTNGAWVELTRGAGVVTLTGAANLTNKTLVTPTITDPNFTADAIDDIGEIEGSLKSGSDATLITGTAGSSGNVAEWNADGDIVDGPASHVGVTLAGTPNYITISGQVITRNDVDLAADVTGVLPVANGGTNLSANAVGSIWIDGASVKGMTTNPSGDADRLSQDEEYATNDVNSNYMLFDAVNEQGFFQAVLPKGWDAGTITFIPVAIPTAGSGTWAFELAAVSIGNNVDPDVAFGTGQTSTDTLLTAARVHIGPESSAITVGNTPVKEEIVFFRIKLTTLNVTAVKLLGLTIKFTLDSYTDL